MKIVVFRLPRPCLPPEDKICPTITGYCPVFFNFACYFCLLFLRILYPSCKHGDKNFVRKISAPSFMLKSIRLFPLGVRNEKKNGTISDRTCLPGPGCLLQPVQCKPSSSAYDCPLLSDHL